MKELEPKQVYVIGIGNVLKVYVNPVTGASIYIVEDYKGEVKAMTVQ